MTTKHRPYVNPRAYTWKADDRTETPGIALMHGSKIRAHMSYAEARILADQIHDIADHHDAGTPTPSTEQEPTE